MALWMKRPMLPAEVTPEKPSPTPDLILMAPQIRLVSVGAILRPFPDPRSRLRVDPMPPEIAIYSPIIGWKKRGTRKGKRRGT